MKKTFITGLIILLPLALTLMVVNFIFNFLTAPFLEIVKGLFESLGWIQNGWGIFTNAQLQNILSKLIILFTLLGATVLLGMLAQWVFIHYLIRIGDFILHRIPLINTIYKTSQDVIKTIFATDKGAFKRVVLVPFPNKETLSLGMVTKDDLSSMGYPDSLVVFIATTPNPTSGFLVIVKKEEVQYTDIKIEDALKYIISCGVIMTPEMAKYHGSSICPSETTEKDKI